MSGGRILHLAINEKFIDYAWRSFENVAPGRSDFWIFFDEDATYIKHTPHEAIRARDRLGFALVRRIQQYDFVVVHSLHRFWVPVINACPEHVVFVWMGWGYDYYDILYPDPEALLLPATRSLKRRAAPPAGRRSFASPALRWKSRALALLERIRLDQDRVRAIQKIRLFSPVLPVEYEPVRSAFMAAGGGRRFPMQTEWNYGSLEEVWARDFLGHTCNGRNILLGNSASYTSNHADLIAWLSDQRAHLQGRKIFCTLSYGDDAYAEQVRALGDIELPDSFHALKDYLSLSEYTAILASCSHLLMNHVRQQGVGTVVIMLYLGAVVVLREECPTYHYLKDLGFVVQSLQSMQAYPESLKEGLEPAQQEHHRELLARHWSKLAIDRKTLQVIETAQHAGSTSPEGAWR